MVSITYDQQANALYVKLIEDKKVAKTILIQDGNYMDISEDNQPIGLEFILPYDAPEEALKILSKFRQPITSS